MTPPIHTEPAAGSPPALERYRQPLRQFLSSETPGYYADLAKPIWAWTLDDALECAWVRRKTPDQYPLDVRDFMDFLNRTDRAGRDGVSRQAQLEFEATRPYVERLAKTATADVAAVLDLLADELVVLPEGSYFQRPVPAGGADREWDVLTQPIWQYTLDDVIHNRSGEKPLRPERVRRWLVRLDNRRRDHLDTLVDRLVATYEPALEDLLSDYSRRLCGRLADLQQAVLEMTGPQSG